jgi:hypothetical protein
LLMVRDIGTLPLAADCFTDPRLFSAARVQTI